MPYRSWLTVSFLTPLFFRYHLPLSLYNLFAVLFFICDASETLFVILESFPFLTVCDEFFPFFSYCLHFVKFVCLLCHKLLPSPPSPCVLGGFNFILFWNFNRNHAENDRYCQKKNNFLLFEKCLKMYSFFAFAF